MGRRVKSVAAGRAEARVYLAKAEQFLAEARSAVDAQRHDAAMLNSIHSGISATDAVSIVLGGRRSADPDHQRAADLLEEVAGQSSEVRDKIKQLRALIARKNAVEYESRRATGREAADALARADRLFQWATKVLRRGRV